jgi:F0F1-type ATP synthase membrane subunit b/b'
MTMINAVKSAFAAGRELALRETRHEAMRKQRELHKQLEEAKQHQKEIISEAKSKLDAVCIELEKQKEQARPNM